MKVFDRCELVDRHREWADVTWSQWTEQRQVISV